MVYLLLAGLFCLSEDFIICMESTLTREGGGGSHIAEGASQRGFLKLIVLQRVPMIFETHCIAKCPNVFLLLQNVRLTSLLIAGHETAGASRPLFIVDLLTPSNKRQQCSLAAK